MQKRVVHTSRRDDLVAKYCLGNVDIKHLSDENLVYLEAALGHMKDKVTQGITEREATKFCKTIIKGDGQTLRKYKEKNKGEEL